MKTQTFTVFGELAKLNEHDNANRSNRFGGAALKKRMTDLVSMQCGSVKPITGQCIISFEWHYSSRHDFDNIRFACKYVLDGLVKSGRLPNDNQSYVVGFGGDTFIKTTKGNEKVVVTIHESPRPL